MKIVVISNCQVGGLVGALRVFLPGSHVVMWHWLDISARRQAALDDIRSSDVVVCTAASDWLRALEAEPGVADVPILTAPHIEFDAFHPDLVLAWFGGVDVMGPASHYQSAIALWAWSHGLDADRTSALFTPEISRDLGYEDRWAGAVARLRADFAQHPGFDADAFLLAAQRRGVFMHSFNHPVIGALADLARQIAARLGAPADTLAQPAEDFLDDYLNMAVWPVYPGIAARLGVPGSLIWRLLGNRVVQLDAFLHESFAAYAGHDPATLTCDALRDPAFDRVLGRAVEDLGLVSRSRAPRPANPYRGLPAERFWSQAVALAPPGGVDPAGDVGARIQPEDRVATMGSCFAQHISRHLEDAGFRYFVTEDVPEGTSDEEAHARGFRDFSARYGNVYTVRQARQLFDRAFGELHPVDDVWSFGRRFVDPFRPRIEPGGFDSPEAVLASREEHLAAVRRVFVETDVLVFTLGLTEAWASTRDGAVVPLAPGVHGGDPDDGGFRFVNSTAAEVGEDLDALVARIRQVNPTVRVLLTVSPVPLVATYEDRHVLVSNTVSKAVLRVAADEAARRHDAVDYFPSYEIIAGSAAGAGYFEPDLRSVSARGVAHVMRVFDTHLLARGPGDRHEATTPVVAHRSVALSRSRAAVVCDEETIERVFGAVGASRGGA